MFSKFLGIVSNMRFLGSVKLDASKRFTMIKEVAEILQVNKDDNIMFYIENGEIILRKVLPMKGSMVENNIAEFKDWERKRRMEISLEEDTEAKDVMIEDLEKKIEEMDDYIKACKEFKN